MSKVHGRLSAILLGAADISQYCNQTTEENSADTHDTTTYGAIAHEFTGGLLNGKFTIGGFYDNAVGGPRNLIKPLLGTTTTYTYRPEGTGSAKPQTVVDCVVASYNQSAPVAEMVTWTAELQPSGTQDDTPQPV
jgi:hypothetical protein